MKSATVPDQFEELGLRVLRSGKTREKQVFFEVALDQDFYVGADRFSQNLVLTHKARRLKVLYLPVTADGLIVSVDLPQTRKDILFPSDIHDDARLLPGILEKSRQYTEKLTWGLQYLSGHRVTTEELDRLLEELFTSRIREDHLDHNACNYVKRVFNRHPRRSAYDALLAVCSFVDHKIKIPPWRSYFESSALGVGGWVRQQAFSFLIKL
jgi:hypothetical protein